MAIESCCIPLPSEIVMPLAGVMLATGKILSGVGLLPALVLIALVGSLGCVLGSTVAYGIGYAGGRPLMLKYGRYVLISQHDADRADAFFKKYGSATAFFSRLLPVVRTYISLPAGITKMPFVKFIVYSFLGSFPWCLLLAYVGTLIGGNLTKLAPIFHGLDIFIIVGVVVLVALYIWRHIRNDRKARAAHAVAASGPVAPPQPLMQSNWGQQSQQQGWGQPPVQPPFQQRQPPVQVAPTQQNGWGPPQHGWNGQPAMPPQQGWGQQVPPQSQQPPQPFQQQGWGQPVPPQQQGWERAQPPSQEQWPSPNTNNSQNGQR
ncbi:MAG: DedA family protein [Ktedonobacteraceae bacterium]